MTNTHKLDTLFEQARTADKAALESWREALYYTKKLEQATAAHDAARAEANWANAQVIEEIKKVNAGVKLRRAIERVTSRGYSTGARI